MKLEIKTHSNPSVQACQNCKCDFTIEIEDFNFYEKIKVPPPTFCPECRNIRRLCWRNTRSLYKRECGLCNKPLVSMYDDGPEVYCNECWNSDKWDQHSSGRDYNFSKLFFVQLKELWNTAPRFFQYRSGNFVNSDFSNYSVNNKNVYLAYSVIDCEDVMYSETIEKSKNSLDSNSAYKIDNSSYNVDCDTNYNTHYAVKSSNCIDSYFLFDCSNCQNCCLSSNLRNQKFVFDNKKMTEEEYRNAIEKMNLNTHRGILLAQEKFDNMVKNKAIHRFALIVNSNIASGDYIKNSKNIKLSFDVWDAENIAYSFRATQGIKDSYDVCGGGLKPELTYETLAASVYSYKNYFCYITLTCRECEYSGILRNCSYCFGCFGLNNAKYCIFNKQYSEEEYFDLVTKIKGHMNEMPYVDDKGRIYKYGEYFPFDMSPFGYNETNANDFFPIKKSEATEKGYNWKERNGRDYHVTIKSEDLPNDIRDVSPGILDEIISCSNNGDQAYQCTTAFKIVPNELQFYKQKDLPLPHYCPNCRHYQRLKYRNRMHLYHRSCMKEGCKNKFETSYAPGRPEIVYCENCYNKEIY
ncbi:MAG: hypothetical protein WCI93_03460 [bacterium]